MDYNIIADNLENALREIKGAWLITKTTKVKPMGFLGYEFVHYDKDDISILVELRAKTLKGLKTKIWDYGKRTKNTKTKQFSP
jgi:hypothetical protein